MRRRDARGGRACRSGRPSGRAPAGRPRRGEDPALDALSGAIGLLLAADRELLQVVWTSLWISLLAALGAALLGVPLGVLCARRAFAGRSLLQQALNALMAVPTVVVGLLLFGLLSRQGPLGHWGLLYTPAAVLIGQAVLVLPILWNLSWSAVASADPRVVDTALALGASRLQSLWLLLAEVRYGIVAAVVMGFGRALGEIGVAMMLGGNIEGFTRTLTTAIALETGKGEFEFALALGLVLLALAFCVVALLGRLQRAA